MKEKLKSIPEPALYEQLAEECTELGKAALKMARVLRKENPTPVKLEEAQEMILEELSDVATVCEVLDLSPIRDLMRMKIQRWVGRLEEKDGIKQSDRDTQSGT